MPQWVTDLANQAIRNAPLPVARALNQIPGGPTLVLGAANTLYNIYSNYKDVSGSLDSLYQAADAKTTASVEQVRKKAKLFHSGAVPPPVIQSSAIQSPHDPRSQGGSKPDVNMVRRMGLRRARRYRNPGTSYRRIFRTWTGLRRLRARRRGYCRPELKHIDGIAAVAMLFQQTNTVCAPGSADGNLVLLNACAQGTTAHGRIGERIQIKSILVRACIQVPDADVAQVSFSQCVRVMIVLDRQPNGLSFAVNDLLDTSHTASNVVTSGQNLTYRQRFKILCDRHYVLAGASNAAEYLFEYYAKKNITVEYNGTSATPTVAEIRTNALWLCLYGPYAAGGNTTNRPHLSSCFFRTRFVDP